jgi:hypothetical protein
MTLREALTHIGKAEHCSLKAASRQLGGAIADREVDARWPHALHLSGDWDDEDIGPPRDARFWRSARVVLVAGGSILDDPSCRTNHTRLQLIRNGTLHYRPVLISREAVERIWRIANKTAEPPRQTMDQTRYAEEPHRASDAHGPDREALSERIRQRAREVYGDPANDRPNVNKAHELIKPDFPGVRRTRIMEILAEDEFARQRKKPGNQPKKS